MRCFPSALFPKWITILTGAGVSAESGIPTFRDHNGLWENHRIEDVACPESFERSPALVQRFYNDRRRALQEPRVKPNAAHFALAQLQREFLGRVTLVTQNIDNLHERGGSTNVHHMHGEMLTARCCVTGDVEPWVSDITPSDTCRCCRLPGTLRPNIVWFGEMPMCTTEIYQALEKTDLFVAIGTSGHVYPAAGFVREAKINGAKTLQLNLVPGENESLFDASVYGNATDVVPKWVESVLRQQSELQDRGEQLLHRSHQ